MNNILTRASDFEIRELMPATREIVGVITTNTVDRYGEVVEPNGARLANYRKNPVVLLNHMTWGLPIGKNIWIKPEGNGLFAKTQFADTAEGFDAFTLYEGGFMKAWSIGFLPMKWEDGQGNPDQPRRRFTEWELLEYSAVTVPANPDAVTNALTRCESPRIREALEAQKTFLNLEERVTGLISSIETRDLTIAELQEKLERIETLYERLSIEGLETHETIDTHEDPPQPGLEQPREIERHAAPPQTKTTTTLEVLTSLERNLPQAIERTLAEILGGRA